MPLITSGRPSLTPMEQYCSFTELYPDVAAEAVASRCLQDCCTPWKRMERREGRWVSSQPGTEVADRGGAAGG